METDDLHKLKYPIGNFKAPEQFSESTIQDWILVLEKFPFKLENNEAVLSYEYNNKMHYYKIANIEEKEMIAYPSSNPNNKL